MAALEAVRLKSRRQLRSTLDENHKVAPSRPARREALSREAALAVQQVVNRDCHLIRLYDQDRVRLLGAPMASRLRSRARSFISSTGVCETTSSMVALRKAAPTSPKGSIFGFLGPNGSGKSTTVKMLTELLRPTAGDALVGGKSVLTSELEIKRETGVLPEDTALFESLSIWKHLMLCGPLYGLSRAETQRRADPLLKYLDVWSERHMYVEQASYGMKIEVLVRDGRAPQPEDALPRRALRGHRPGRLTQYQRPARVAQRQGRHGLPHIPHP